MKKARPGDDASVGSGKVASEKAGGRKRGAREPVSMKDIAQIANVTQSTVSLALRNSPRISVKTRARVCEAARQLGYRPNPLVSALMVQRARQRAGTYQATLGFIFPRMSGPPEPLSISGEYWTGALGRARQLGFKLEVFCLGAGDYDGKSLGRIFQARNIPGLILGPASPPLIDGFRPVLDWGRYSLVTVGYSVRTPAVHRSAAHVHHVVRLATSRLRKRGYRRIGMVQSSHTDDRAENQLTSSFLGWQYTVPAEERMPLLYFPEREDKQVFRRWVRAVRPDAVLSTSALLDVLADWLREMRYRVPEDIAILHMNWTPERKTVSGVHQNNAAIGAEAVSLLARQLFANETGLPESPLAVLTEGRWIEGQTTPDRRG